MPYPNAIRTKVLNFMRDNGICTKCTSRLAVKDMANCNVCRKQRHISQAVYRKSGKNNAANRRYYIKQNKDRILRTIEVNKLLEEQMRGINA